MWRACLFAGRFLTRLPLPDPGEPQGSDLGRAALCYPLVGLGLGGLVWGLVAAIQGLHPGAAASAALWDEPDEDVVAEVLAAAQAFTARPLVALEHSVQRWRYARPSVSHPDRHLVLSGLPPLVLAGDAFGEPKVEGAVRSGASAASAVREALAAR
jgi:hypothetical protein